jgi:exosome complex component CSL4
VYASLCGVVQVSTAKDGQQRTVTVIHNTKDIKDRLPTIDSIVTCRVLFVNNLQAKCQINCVNEHLLNLPFKAILRKEDVRAEDRDRVEMHNSFRPRDIILARVFGMSDTGYLLSTAEDSLGVVLAYNQNRTFLSFLKQKEFI